MKHSTRQRHYLRPFELYLYDYNGVFESMRAYKGRISGFDAHINRFYESSLSIGLNLSYTRSQLKNMIVTGLKRSKFKNAYIRVSIAGCKNRVNIIVKKFLPYPDEFYKNGVDVIIVPTMRNTIGSLDSKIKSSNFLNGIFAKIETGPKGAFEAICLSNDGFITEGTVSNIFIIKRDEIFTPPSFTGALDGITRRQVIGVARGIGLCVYEQPLTRYDIYNADEIFLTNTSIEIMPVVSVDKREIGDGKVGLFTKRLHERLKEKLYGQGKEGTAQRI